MDLIAGIAGQMASPIRSIFRGVADIPKRFAGDRDDRGLFECEFSRRANVQRESRARPTENRLPDRAPLPFRRDFNDNDSRLVAGRIM